MFLKFFYKSVSLQNKSRKSKKTDQKGKKKKKNLLKLISNHSTLAGYEVYYFALAAITK